MVFCFVLFFACLLVSKISDFIPYTLITRYIRPQSTGVTVDLVDTVWSLSNTIDVPVDLVDTVWSNTIGVPVDLNINIVYMPPLSLSSHITQTKY